MILFRLRTQIKFCYSACFESWFGRLDPSLVTQRFSRFHRDLTVIDKKPIKALNKDLIHEPFNLEKSHRKAIKITSRLIRLAYSLARNK